MTPRLTTFVPLILFLCSVTLNAFSDQPRCGAMEMTARLRSTEPFYAEALIVVRNLTAEGFKVQCVLESKMGNMFEGELGAALFRTDRADFDVLFLPYTQTFDALEVKDEVEDGHHIYSFKGSPKSPVRFESAVPTYFVKRANELFVLDDATVATTLKTITLQ